MTNNSREKPRAKQHHSYESTTSQAYYKPISWWLILDPVLSIQT